MPSEYCVDWYDLSDFLDDKIKNAYDHMNKAEDSVARAQWSGAAWAFDVVDHFIGEYAGHTNDHPGGE